MLTTIDGIKTAYLEEGAGGLIVLLHGWSKRKEEYDELAALLSTNHRVIRVDLPGFGESDLPPTSWCVGDYARFTSLFLAEAHLNGPIIIGHSFGGRVAIKMTSGNREIAKQLILIDSAGIERKSFVTRLLIKFARFTPFSAKGGLSSVLGSSDYTKLTGVMKETFKNVVNENLEGDLAKIQTPTLIIWGEEDHTTPLWQGRRMHELIHGSKFMTIPNANHGLPYRNAREAAKIIENFIL